MQKFMTITMVCAVAFAIGCSGGDSKDHGAKSGGHEGSHQHGSGDGSKSGGHAGGGTPPAEGSGAAGGGPAGDAVDKMATAAATVSSCLSLVGQKNYNEAVPVCTKAVGMDPQNGQVQQALASAKAGLAALANADMGKVAKDAANAAAGAAADKAMGAANDAMKQAAPPAGTEGSH